MNWRFIPYAQFDGATNMAVDVALLERAATDPPVLRLYGFSPPCLSIGMAQKLPADTIARVHERGWELVRRPSGGRAVLHYKDLTYSFVGSQKGRGEFGFLETSVSGAYKQICQGLKEAFQLLGLVVELGPAQASYRHLADCFLATTNADLHFNGRKLAGSAQLRRHGCVLQHGSIPLNLEQELVPELLVAKLDPKLGIEDRHANLFEMLESEVSFEELNQVMKAGFEKAFEVEFEEKGLSRKELSQASEAKVAFTRI